MRVAFCVATFSVLLGLPPQPVAGQPRPARLSSPGLARAPGSLELAPGSYDLAPRIVNGLPTSAYPTVGLLTSFSPTSPFPVACTGTLIGCETFLTAAHCVAGNLEPSNHLLYFQVGGFFGVTAVEVHPSYSGVGGGHDVAVLRLDTPVNGLAPSRINTVSRPVHGTAGTIVGFGRIGGPSQSTGVKRAGLMSTAACSGVAGDTHLCWNFQSPIGPAGTDSNTCQGDSGGPMFAQLSGMDVITGLTSGGNTSCLQPDSPFDADVFVDRAWIREVAGPDLDRTACGPLPAAGSALAPIFGAAGVLSSVNTEDDLSFEVPAGTQLLAATLNAETGTDFDLYLNPGSPALPGSAACASASSLSIEGCIEDSPAAGTWFVRAGRFEGSGQYQVTVTLFQDTTGGAACVPGPQVLCIDDQPGDRRFEARVAWNRPGASGQAGAIPLASVGVSRGGLFWIGNAGNPEILLKVLNACGVNGNYWVFYSAGTSQGLEVTVVDTATGETWSSVNPDGTLAPPVADTSAFPCS